MHRKKYFCSICWEYFYTINTLEPCNHVFCKNCLTKQLKRDARCAICRKTIFSCDPHIIPFETKYKTITIEKNINERPLGIELILENEIVKIKSAQKNRSEFKVDQQIISVNGLPVLSPNCFTQILQSDNIKPFYCQVVKYPIKNTFKTISRINALLKTLRF